MHHRVFRREPVTFINVFEIGEDEIDTFITKWKERSRFTTSADGFISAELFRSIDADTHFKLINVTKWAGRAHFEAATHAAEFRAELDDYQTDDSCTWTPSRGFYHTAARFD
ncbi:antibiotic biosynthesis monooxygenase [Microlunatus elymi]|uniref:Antibiotic biosynthesis monooxygenase n=1 Tax=Microlunatus elymi TaxID=2596828 RepID=A0A516Q597_9ACTN|nr:antibiotic biosynthesis monooxygenase [Microlunatus elymi]